MPPGKRYDGSIGPVGRRPRPSGPPKGAPPVTAGGGGGKKGGCLSMLLAASLALAVLLGAVLM